MIYVHVPFCRSFCRYCDFYSEIACRGRENFEDYIRELCLEAQSRKAEIEAASAVDTLYIGGGTPSVMPLPFFESLLEALDAKNHKFREFTVEVNPDDITGRGPDFARALRDLGANRISMGVQSLDDGMLRWMGRRHSAAQAATAVSILRQAGFDNISLDLIFGVNGMSLEMLDNTINGLLALQPEHISAYQLSIESGSELARQLEEGVYTELPDEQCREQYELICRRLREAGYKHYEISNWAKPGREAIHNSAYWTRAPYVGLGPGAHSLAIRADGTQLRSWNPQTTAGWLRVRAAHPEDCQELLTPEEIEEERIMLGLRTARGTTIDGHMVRIPESDWFIADSIIHNYI